MFQRQSNEQSEQQSVEQHKIATRFHTDLGMLLQHMQALLTNMDNYLVDQKAKGQQYLADGLRLTKTRDSLAASVKTCDGILTRLGDAFHEHNYSLPPKYRFTHNDELLMLKPDELTKYYANEIARSTAVFAGYRTLMEQDSQPMKNKDSISATSSDNLYNKHLQKQEDSSNAFNDADSSISRRLGH